MDRNFTQQIYIYILEIYGKITKISTIIHVLVDLRFSGQIYTHDNHHTDSFLFGNHSMEIITDVVQISAIKMSYTQKLG